MQEAEELETVLISGMGPAGLAAACEAVLSNKRVVIVTNRPINEQIRPQHVTLTWWGYRCLHELLTRLCQPTPHFIDEDNLFMNALDYDLSFAIKRIERFLLRRIQECMKRGYPIEIIENAEISGVSFEPGTATVGSRTIKINDLICADGVGRHAIKICNRDFTDDRKISHVPDEGLTPSKHVTAYMTISTANGTPIEGQLPVESIYIDSYDNYFYALIFKSNIRNNAVKCNIIAEIPTAVNGNSDEAVTTYLQILVNRALNCDTVIKIVESKDLENKAKKANLNFSIFDMNSEEADFSIMRHKGVRVILMGDAYRTPNYQIGSGLSDVFSQSKVLGRLFRKEWEVDELKYDEECKYLGKNAKLRTIGISNNSVAIESMKRELSKRFKDYELKKNRIKILRRYFYSCMPEIKDEEISLFSMLNYYDEQGRTFLHIAIDNDTLELPYADDGPIQIFNQLDYFSEPRTQGQTRQSLLEYAIFRGKLSFIDLLLKKKLQDCSFKEDNTTLEYALSCDINTFKSLAIYILKDKNNHNDIAAIEKLRALMMKNTQLVPVIREIIKSEDLKDIMINWSDIVDSASNELQNLLTELTLKGYSFSLSDIFSQVEDHIKSSKPPSPARHYRPFAMFLSPVKSPKKISHIEDAWGLNSPDFF